MDVEYDVLIVGARVAGAVLAARLGDAGHRVLLVDRATFPSPTLSTHYFRGGDAVTVLQQLGVLGDLLALGAPPLTCEYRYQDCSATGTVGPPQHPGEIGYCLSIRREPLDACLVQRAAYCPTVDLREQTRLVELLWEHGRVVGATLKTRTGEDHVRARIVVGADGRHSLLARRVEAASEAFTPPFRATYYCYVRDFAGVGGRTADGPEFSLCDGDIAYAFPSDGGLTCIALSVDLETYDSIRTRADAGFRERIAAHHGIAERFAASQWASPLLACGPEPNYVREPYGPGWALVGDAGLHVDPWIGVGIDMATRHATYLAEALGTWLSGRISEQGALAAYHQRRNEHGFSKYHAAIALAQTAT